jgi:hypothetical protein
MSHNNGPDTIQVIEKITGLLAPKEPVVVGSIVMGWRNPSY